MNRTYKVFLSHGSEDSFIVEETLLPAIEKSGASVFVDSKIIHYGDDFRRIILSELKNCEELLVLITKSSLQRPWVIAEIGAALICNKRVVAIKYGPDEVELQQKGVLSLLGTVNILPLDKRNFKGYIKQLKARVEGFANE